MAVVVTEIDRVAAHVVAGFQSLGVATVHDAQGRKGLLASYMRPLDLDLRAVGTAVTVQVSAGDNWMIHVATEICQPGDILVVSPTSPCGDGYIGDLIAGKLMSCGVRGLVIDAGVRDAATLRKMQFPVWSRTISAQATVKETLGDINCPLVCAGQLIHAGDLIVGDGDGVVVVRREEAEQVLDRARERERREEEIRARLAAGEVGVDIYGMRERLKGKGLQYVKRAR
ncbi:4-carboxy-4-hydroxy-2-oxoadipate aldolase/oxaloacetate decarboxylase [Steroidobacter sp.]|uniref:4-carboxy-4-hydroxy-2-oxoadipate aldolase/oxaloacetate decarboxylase n=1 Tax=Steroidobacter sp. TaxID=1978227 RepID=UPI0025EFC938|nr:4-carboxy-4-hydroxy-2-oxoadipate aldolase/oxaloacetate decarboxylase [Steroidobacter sp.]